MHDQIRIAPATFAVLTVMGLIGLTGPDASTAGVLDWLHHDKGEQCDDVCVDGACEPACTTGACGSTCGPGGCPTEPKWHSDEWYAMRAHLPPGERPRYKHGKLTPVEPRPDLPPQPYWHVYHSVKNWPHPYDCRDRDAVRMAYVTMEDEGWAELTTLHDYHFDAETGLLNAAGVAKVKYVLTGVPAPHKRLYVADSLPHHNAMRIANVRAGLVDLTGTADSIAVLTRMASNGTRPAMEVETINRARLQQMIPPVITYGPNEAE